MTDWNDFEQVLLIEFRSILSTFHRIDCLLSLDTRKDFLGLLFYILNDRSRFRDLALTEFGIETTRMTTLTETTTTDEFDAEEFLESVLNSNDLLLSYSPEFSKFPRLLGISNPKIFDLSERYWNFRYPSLKQSFIIPFALNFPPSPSSNLFNLLKRRLLKGKLQPFDQSILLAKKLNLKPSDLVDGYFDHQLSALKGILSNHSHDADELSHVLQQLGCHCD